MYKHLKSSMDKILIQTHIIRQENIHSCLLLVRLQDAIKGLKVAYGNLSMFLGMIKETSKEQKWSMEYKDSTYVHGRP